MNIKIERLYFIDWLRIIALAILWFFHSSLIFNETINFHIRNKVFIPHLDDILYFFHQWRLTLLFFISGVGSYYAMKKYQKGFIKERVRRLLIPLLFGVIIIVPPQIYIERIYNGFYYDSFLQFYLQSFSNGLYPAGDISWHHLWFLAYLFCYVILFILFRKIFTFIKNEFNYKIPLMYLIIPLVVFEALLRPYSLGVQNIVQDMAMFIFYFLIYVYGILFASNTSYFQDVEKKKKIFLLITIILTIAIYLFKNYVQVEYSVLDMKYYIDSVIHTCHRWFCVLTIVGYAKKYLNNDHRYLSAGTKSILPLYILHQTAIILIGFYVIQWQLSPYLKLGVVILSSFAVSLIIYFFIIQKIRIFRVVFGIDNYQ